MANNVFTLKANSTGGTIPAAGVVAVGELAINTGDGKLYSKMANGTVIQINSGTGGATPGGVNTQIQFNDSGVFSGDASLLFDKTTDILKILNTTTNANVQFAAETMIIGNTTTSYSIDYSNIIDLGRNLAALGIHTY
jgi:hypothetical protein